jgi:hypothetical protein
LPIYKAIIRQNYIDKIAILSNVLDRCSILLNYIFEHKELKVKSSYQGFMLPQSEYVIKRVALMNVVEYMLGTEMKNNFEREFSK